MQQEPPNAAAERLASLDTQLPGTLSTEQTFQVLDRLASGGGAWTAEEIAAVPDGTEPSFIFRPLRVSAISPIPGKEIGSPSRMDANPPVTQDYPTGRLPRTEAIPPLIPNTESGRSSRMDATPPVVTNNDA